MARATGIGDGPHARSHAGVTASPGDAPGAWLWVRNTDTRAQHTQRRHPSRQASVDAPLLSVQLSGATTVSSSVVCTAKTASQRARKSRTRQTISRADGANQAWRQL